MADGGAVPTLGGWAISAEIWAALGAGASDGMYNSSHALGRSGERSREAI
jgi:hypothetical protein